MVDLTIGNQEFKVDRDNILFLNGVKCAKIINSDDNNAYLIFDEKSDKIANYVLKRFGLIHYITVGYVNTCVPRNKITFDVDFNIPHILFKEYSESLEKYKTKFDIKYIPYQNPNHYEYFQLYLRQNDIMSDKLRILYHGSEEKNIQSILERGFSLATSHKWGEAHGSGIYFTNDLEFTLKYAMPKNRTQSNVSQQPIQNANKACVVVSEVYVNNTILGRNNPNILPKMPGTSKDYDTAVDDQQNPKQFIKKDPKDGINILGHFELTLKEDYLKKKFIKPNVNQNYTYTYNNNNFRSTYQTIHTGVCDVPDCKCSSMPKTGYCNQCWRLIKDLPPGILGCNTQIKKIVSDKNSEWYKKRFGNASKYRTFNHECPKCRNSETMFIRNLVYNCHSVSIKNQMTNLLEAKLQNKNICICSEIIDINKKLNKSKLDMKNIKSIAFKNETPYEIDIYYKPKNFNLYTDDITKCKKMTINGLLKQNDTWHIKTKIDDEFIIGYYLNNELNILKIITVDFKQVPCIISI